MIIAILNFICTRQRLYIVDIVSQSWNQLYSWVFEASEAILGGRQIENSLIYEQ